MSFVSDHAFFEGGMVMYSLTHALHAFHWLTEQTFIADFFWAG
jgi:hypothetical protein